MNTTSHTKETRKKYIYVAMLILIAISIFGIALFYFWPIPEEVKQHPGKISRCLNEDGINYEINYSCADCGYGLFNSNGEAICSSSTWGGSPSNCSAKLCFPINDKFSNNSN